MIRLIDMLNHSDYRHYIFYGEKELPNIVVNTKFGVFDLSKIKWEKVDKMNNGFFNYSKAILQICCATPSATHIAWLLDRVCFCDYFTTEDDKTLFICCERKKQ